MEKIKLGIHTCLMGAKVRYDGSHKLEPFLTETLGQYVEYVPVCPEGECGLPFNPWSNPPDSGYRLVYG